MEYDRTPEEIMQELAEEVTERNITGKLLPPDLEAKRAAASVQQRNDKEMQRYRDNRQAILEKRREARQLRRQETIAVALKQKANG